MNSFYPYDLRRHVVYINSIIPYNCIREFQNYFKIQNIRIQKNVHISIFKFV